MAERQGLGRIVRRLTLCVALAAVVLTWLPPQTPAQVGGVYVDAEGVLRRAETLSDDERLELIRTNSVEPPATRAVAASSPLRKVSLRRLEAAVAALHDGEKAIPSEIACLAGLLRVQYVFFDPEAGDVIVAGPAEGWRQAPSGEVVGAQSGRPVLQLDDLIIALRFAMAEQRPAPFIGCSIEPTAEGIQRHAAFLRGLRGFDRSRLPQIFAGMEEAMGPQDVKVYGVPGSSRFALKLVAADYRLKRLALGHDPSPVPQVVNYLDLAAQRFRGGAQPQHRWWFVAEYDEVRHTPDHLAFELVGQGTRVLTAPTFPSAQTSSPDKKTKAGEKGPKPSPAAVQFAETFTKHFPAMAEKVPVFAELQNLIALAVTAELIAERSRAATGEPNEAAEAPGNVWRPAHFLDETSCRVEEISVPTKVPSITNSRLVAGRHWLISTSGGVEIAAERAMGREVRREVDNRKLDESRKASRERPGDRWWWD